mgnify:CR=1 FL=1|tara:strand:- start:227 stop:673 length:447 start_codon:yes stop_codon:yes gene_type:complete
MTRIGLDGRVSQRKVIINRGRTEAEPSGVEEIETSEVGEKSSKGSTMRKAVKSKGLVKSTGQTSGSGKQKDQSTRFFAMIDNAKKQNTQGLKQMLAEDKAAKANKGKDMEKEKQKAMRDRKKQALKMAQKRKRQKARARRKKQRLGKR